MCTEKCSPQLTTVCGTRRGRGSPKTSERKRARGAGARGEGARTLTCRKEQAGGWRTRSRWPATLSFKDDGEKRPGHRPRRHRNQSPNAEGRETLGSGVSAERGTSLPPARRARNDPGVCLGRGATRLLGGERGPEGEISGTGERGLRVDDEPFLPLTLKKVHRVCGPNRGPAPGSRCHARHPGACESDPSRRAAVGRSELRDTSRPQGHARKIIHAGFVKNAEEELKRSADDQASGQKTGNGEQTETKRRRRGADRGAGPGGLGGVTGRRPR